MMAEDRASGSVPDGVTDDPDDELDLPGERLDDDFDVASAREQDHRQQGYGHATDPFEADEVVDGS
jgi:hypothetical protein